MLAAVLGVVTLTSMASAVTLKDAHNYKEHLKFECPANEIINRVHSEHHDGHEDRRWSFTCGYAPSGASLSDCAWSGFVSNWKEAGVYQCHDGGVLTGWESEYDKDDRRTKFRCCKAKGYLSHSCHYTGYLNAFDETLSYRVPEGSAITGVFSYYDSGKKDRRFNFNICALDLSA